MGSSETTTGNVSQLRRERSYQFEGATVDPDRSYTKARDESGHSEWIKIRIPPRLYDQALQFIGKNSPVAWRSFSHAVRDSLLHRVAYLSSRFGDDDQQRIFQTFVQEATWLEQMAIEEEARKWVAQARDQIDAIVTDYVARNQPDIGLEKLDHWLAELPNREEPHTGYIASYIKDQMTHLRQVIHSNQRVLQSS